MLSVINSVFDSFGFLQPVIVEGKILLREMMSLTRELIGMTPARTLLQQVDLMDGLIKLSWESPHTKDVLQHLLLYKIDANHKDFLVYADTSKNAVVAVAYLKMYDGTTFTTKFLKGKAKLDPMHGFLVWNYVKLYLPPI